MKKLPAAFRSKRIELRPLRISDYQEWKTGYLARKSKVYPYDLKIPKGAKFSKIAFAKVIRKHRSLAKKDKVYVLGVFHRKTNQYLGHVDLAVIYRSDMQWGNLGYGILNQYYGNGFGREAALAALKIGFKFLDFHRLEAVINLDNLRSIKLAKSIGMKAEGKRRAFIFENGRWADHLVFSAIPEDMGLRSKKPKQS